MQNSKTMVNDLTEGSVVKKLLVFALPLFASNLMQAVYNVVDMIVVGRVVGGTGMSAVNIGGDILNVVTFLAMGFSSAGQVIIAQHVGAGRMQEVKKTIGNMLTFLLITSVLLSVVCLLFRRGILNLLNTPAESYDMTMEYAVTCMAGLVFIYGYNIVSAILRGMGDSRRPFVFVTVAAILNIVLDLWFVAGLSLGAFGAALATVIGQAVSFIGSLIYLYRHREAFGFDFKPESFRLQKDTLSRLVALGIPMALQTASVFLTKIILTSWINTFGVTMSAVSGIYSKIGTMFVVITNAFTTAGSAMTGQCIGAGKFSRVPKVMWTNFLCLFVLGTAMTLLMLFRSDAVFRLFTSDEAVLACTGLALLPIILNFYGAVTRTPAFTLINGSGHSRFNLLVALLDGWVGRLCLARLFGYGLELGCRGIWIGDALAGFVPILIGMAFYFSGKWKS